MFKNSIKMLLVFTIFTLVTACGSTDDSSSSERKEGNSSESLTMYIGVVEEQALKIAQEFEKDTGIKVDFVRMSGGEILSRVRAEKDNPKASIWYGGPADSFVAAKDEELLHPYISPNSENIDDQLKDEDGYWTGIYNEVLGFILDDRFFDERGIDKPSTWKDLLNEEYNGQIAVANPGASGTAFLLLSGMVQELGEEEGLQYMEELDNNVKQYTKSGSAPAKSAGLGEAAIGITFIHNGLRHMEEGFDNISVVAPEDGTWSSTAAVGIIEGAPELDAAKEFVDWALTKEAQEIGQQFGSYQFPSNPDANIPEQAKPYENVNILDYDLDWSGENRAGLVEKWDSAIKEDKKEQ
ncbi:ABC transporter substrate-binding protein [Pseudogracilibacillus sp. SO30301A]|uniref:ABC transporter substrate-binding protein n=1 Tax=Pseudogracilibacillus sp. SO30301A TaxID=3098291 RepID=UPI00300E2203